MPSAAFSVRGKDCLLYGKKARILVRYDVGMLGAKNNDSSSEKLVIVKFYTLKYRKCGNFNSKNDSRLCVGASAFLKSVDFRAFEINVKTIAPKQKLYQSGHAIWCGKSVNKIITYPIGYVVGILLFIAA